MSRPRRRRRRRGKTGRRLLTAVFVCAALFAAASCLFRKPEQRQIPSPAVTPGEDVAVSGALSAHQARKEDFYTILVSGADDGNGGSDTNILVAMDAKNGSIYGLSIPRDTKAVLGGRDYRINAAYNLGGMELLADAVSEQLGIPVDYTVLVDLRAFVALVDAVGGVDFYIPIDMDYDDPYQDLSIHFQQGLRHLNGEEALKVVRFRKGYASQDLGRIQTQQDFLKAVAEQTLTLDNLEHLDDFVRIFGQYVETDLSLGNLLWLGKEAISIGAANVSFSTLPGEWKSPYIHLDPEEVLSVVNGHLNPYTEDRTLDDLNIPE